MAVKAKAIVTRVLDHGTAFALRKDTDESVYINQKIAEAMEIEEFDDIEVVMVRATSKTAKAPWTCVRAKYDPEGSAA